MERVSNREFSTALLSNLLTGHDYKGKATFVADKENNKRIWFDIETADGREATISIPLDRKWAHTIIKLQKLVDTKETVEIELKWVQTAEYGVHNLKSVKKSKKAVAKSRV